MKHIKFSLTLVALAVSSNYSFAQENTTEESTVERLEVVGTPSRFGATKTDIPIIETPRSVSIVTSEEFLDRGALELSNTVNYTAGVTGNAYGSDTRGDTISIRGLDAPQYQDNLQVQFGFWNNARVEVYTLEQVEVLKGPASVLYGQAAPGGIVSTVSKVAGAGRLNKEVVATVGSNDRYQASVDLGADLSGDATWTGRFVGIYRDSGTQTDFVKDDSIVISPSITYETDSTKLTALFNYTERKGDTITQFLPLTVTGCQSSDVTISNPNVCANAPSEQVDSSVYVGDQDFNRYDTKASTLSLFASHQFNDMFSFDGTMRYRDNEADYYQTWITFAGDGNPRLLSNGTAGARSFYGGPAGSDQFSADLRLKADFNTSSIEHNVIVGVNYQDVNTDSHFAFVAVSPTSFNILPPVSDGSEIPSDEAFDQARFNTESNTKATDVYLIDHMTVGNLVVNLGVRYSSVDSKDLFNSQSDDETPISLGALYKTPFNLNPYISYSESFRATVGTDVITNSSLKPRTGEQTEIGIKYQNPNNSNYITVAYFDLEEDNLIQFLATGSTQSGLSVSADGVEVEALFNVGDIAFDFDYRYLDANQVDESGIETPLPSEPKTSASLWTTWDPSVGSMTGFELGFGIRYASENESGIAVNRVVTDGYVVVDAFAAYKFNDNLKAMLNIRNLTDEDYYASCLSRGDCFPGEQQTIVGSVSYNF